MERQYPAGFPALEGDLIDPLFVAMEALRKGVGTTEDEPDVVLLWLPGADG